MKVFRQRKQSHKQKHEPVCAVVRACPGDPKKAVLALGPLRFTASLGRGGISAFKREGDGATPLARMRVMGGFRAPGLTATRPDLDRLIRVTAREGWCDAPAHGSYNRPVRLPFPASHETLRRGDRLYDLVLVLDWNIRRRVRGAGSAIFLHVAREGYLPTEGCIALHPSDLRRVAGPLLGGGHVRVMR